MADGGLLGLVGLGLVLGLRHGIDWDHIAAITDITGSVVTTEEAEPGDAPTSGVPPIGGSGAALAVVERPRKQVQEAREGLFLASFYALGHAILVVVLGLLAIWASAVLPDWLDPIMERIVGITLLLLGFWIFYSLWRYGRAFRLRSRWMLVFAGIARGWSALKSRLTGQLPEHPHELSQYGPRSAFGIGMIHGVGAETGSQAVLLASAAGATTRFTGSVLLAAFVTGLVLSNSMVAAFSVFGFVSSGAKRDVYVAVGVLAGIFSLVVGFFFVTGQGAGLPDLQEAFSWLFGGSGTGA